MRSREPALSEAEGDPMPVDTSSGPTGNPLRFSALVCPMAPRTAPPKTLSFRRASEARQEEPAFRRGPETLRISQPHCNASLSRSVIPTGA
jgi:hypothetical protein